MKSVLEYRNYRQYMRDFFAHQKTHSKFSWRKFSELADFTSSNYLKLVCDGKANLSKNGVDKVASAMELSKIELSFFKKLVAYDQAKQENEKINILRDINLFLNNYGFCLTDEMKPFYESWLHPVVRELAPTMLEATPVNLATKIWPKTFVQEVEHSLNLLVRMNLLKKIHFCTYIQTKKNLFTQSSRMSLAIRAMNRRMANFAINAIDCFSIRERNFTGITMGLSNEAYAKIVALLLEYRNKIVNVVTSDKKTDRIYRLNLQLFPLTEPITNHSQKK